MITSFESLIQEVSRDLKQLEERCQGDCKNLQQILDTQQNAIQYCIEHFRMEIGDARQKKSQVKRNAIEIQRQINNSNTHLAVKQRVIKHLEQYLSLKNKQISKFNAYHKRTQELINQRKQNINRQNLENIDKRQPKSEIGIKMPVKFDNQNKIIEIRLKQGPQSTLLKIKYNSSQDRFFLEQTSSKALLRIVNEFNFHRNIGLMYQALTQIKI